MVTTWMLLFWAARAADFYGNEFLNQELHDWRVGLLEETRSLFKGHHGSDQTGRERIASDR